MFSPVCIKQAIHQSGNATNQLPYSPITIRNQPFFSTNPFKSVTVFSRTASQSVSSCSSTGVESSSGSVSFEEPAAADDDVDEEAAPVDAEPNAADVVG